MVIQNLKFETWNLKPSARGLTLLELVAVMAILAIMATIAVRSARLAAGSSGEVLDATQRQLAQIQSAVLSDPSASSAVASGFVSDMGRPPLALGDASNLQPLELWSNPNTLPAFQLRQAVAANIRNAQTVAVASDGTTTLSAVAAPVSDTAVFVSTGWRGPYLTNIQTTNTVLDGWGNTLKLFKSDGSTAVAFGNAIQQFQSLGADNAVGGDGFNTDIAPVVFY